MSRLSLVIFVAYLAANAEIPASFGNLPLRFEPAQDASGLAKFVTRGNGYTFFLTESGAILKSPYATVRMKMAGGNPSPGITPQEPLPGVSNYLIGNKSSKWRTGVAGFARVKYNGIYPGIDLVYYGKEGRIEYDFVIAPGADPRKIRIVFDGATGLTIDSNGDLVVRAAGKPLRFRKPVLYQNVHGEKRRVAGRYTLHGRRVGFIAPDYDASLPLVIDPVLLYSTLFGGAQDGIFAIATDASGNVYLTGQTFGSITTVKPVQPKFGGNSSNGIANAFITKINAAGTALIYSTFIGGSGGDQAFGIAVDSSGNAYIAGYTGSSDFPTVNPVQPMLRAATNAFVTKLNATGTSIIYSTYLGGSGISPFSPGAVDRANAIAVDSAGNAYVAGSTYSPDFPTLAAFQPALPGQKAAFVTKINAAGSALTYSTYLGGNATASEARPQNSATGIAVDSAGSAYVTGNACSSNFPTVNPIQASNKSTCNVFITKFTPAGSALVYSTYLGGSTGDPNYNFAGDPPGAACFSPSCAGYGGDSSGGIAVDSSGNAYVAGRAISSDFPVVNAFQPEYLDIFAGSDAFVAKLNSSGTALVYSTYLGEDSVATSIAVDPAGNAYVTGGLGSSGSYFPLVNLQLERGGTFIAEFDVTGSALVYSTYFGVFSGNPYSPSAIAVDSAGNTYVAGVAGEAGPYFPLVNAIQNSSGGAFLAKVGPADAAGLAIAPDALSFTDLLFGTSATQTITLLAAGSQPLNIASIAASGNFTQTNSCGLPLNAGAICGVNVTFTPTAAGSSTGKLTITSNSGIPQSVNLTGSTLMPVLTGAAQNSATFSFANVAGSLASVFGTGLATLDEFGGRVTVTGPSGSYPAAVLYQSPTQLNFQIPWEVAGSSPVTLDVCVSALAQLCSPADSVSIPLPLSATAPGILALNSRGSGPGVILISNTAVFAQPVGSLSYSASQPVSPGQFISIYCTGLGALTTAPPADGAPPTGLMPIAAPITVSIGAITATPSFAGLAPDYVGLYQVDVQVPAGIAMGSAVPVFMTVGVVSNTVTIAVQ